MKIIDISWPLASGMTTYKNKDDFATYPVRTWEKERIREARLVCSVHAGTHVDAPAHMLADGPFSESSLRLEALCGPCVVLDLTEVGSSCITEKDLVERTQPQALAGRRVLLKTRNSFLSPIDPFDFSFVFLHESGATYLRDAGAVAVGTDYAGIERDQPDHPTHKIFLAHNIPIIEGLRLSQVAAGPYTLICLPLALVGVDAAPARAVLLPDGLKDLSPTDRSGQGA